MWWHDWYFMPWCGPTGSLLTPYPVNGVKDYKYDKDHDWHKCLSLNIHGCYSRSSSLKLIRHGTRLLSNPAHLAFPAYSSSAFTLENSTKGLHSVASFKLISCWSRQHYRLYYQIEVGSVRCMREVVKVTSEVVKATEIELNAHKWSFLDQCL